MASGGGILGAGGGFGTGLLLLVGGLVVKSSQANMLAECNSGFGRLGQALDPNAASSCSTAHNLSTLATVAIWIGAIMLIFAVGGFIFLLAAAGVMAASEKKGTRKVTAAAQARSGRPGPGTPAYPPSGPAVRPQFAVPPDLHVERNHPAGPPGQGNWPR